MDWMRKEFTRRDPSNKAPIGKFKTYILIALTAQYTKFKTRYMDTYSVGVISLYTTQYNLIIWELFTQGIYTCPIYNPIKAVAWISST